MKLSRKELNTQGNFSNGYEFSDLFWFSPESLRRNARSVLPKGFFVEIRIVPPGYNRGKAIWYWGKKIHKRLLKPRLDRKPFGDEVILYERLKT